jgi:flagellar protein FlbD
MITLTRLDRHPFVLNAELIATAESTPDTLLTLSNGIQFLVREDVDEVVARVIEYRGLVNRGVLRVVQAASDSDPKEKG